MNPKLADRLNQILPRITSDAFLSSEGIGNEIACYIFDYPAEAELQVRDHIKVLTERLATHHSRLRVLHLNLLDVGIRYLQQRGLLEKLVEMQATKDDAAVLRALKGPLTAEKLRDFIAAEHKPAEHDLFLLSGVGSVWPMLRAHNLLNCLHTATGKTPLVMFYPGRFDGTTLRLFGRIATATSGLEAKAYYRAFTLIPGGEET
jgi:hypothetical protein